MADTNWLKQTPDKPLFPDVLWSKPENRSYAGKLLIVGGNAHSFAAPAQAYGAAEKAGVGSVRVLLPDSTRKILAKSFPEAEFAPSTISGSFSKMALATLLENASWADGVLLAGDLGHNSETAILLDEFTKKNQTTLGLTGDALEYFTGSNSTILGHPDLILTTEFSQLQKLVRNNKPEIVIKNSMNLSDFVQKLGQLSQEVKPAVVSSHTEHIVVAAAGQVSTTPAKTVNFTDLASRSMVWSIQQPTKLFESITCAVL